MQNRKLVHFSNCKKATLAGDEQRGRRDEQRPDHVGFSLIQQIFIGCISYALCCLSTGNTAVNTHRGFSAVLWSMHFIMSPKGNP